MSAINEWPPSEYVNSKYNLKDLANTLDQARHDDSVFDYVSYLCEYLTLRSCGHIEVASTECYLAFVARYSSATLEDYHRKIYRSWESPTKDHLQKKLGNIDKELGKAFSYFIEENDTYGDKRATTLKALVDMRGKFAHGKSSSLSAENALRYYEFAIELGQWYAGFLGPGGDAERLLVK